MVRAFASLLQDLRQDLWPRPPRPTYDRLPHLNQSCGLLLRGCRSKDPSYRERCRAALKHIQAARALAELGYPDALVDTVAARGVEAARGA